MSEKTSKLARKQVVRSVTINVLPNGYMEVLNFPNEFNVAMDLFSKAQKTVAHYFVQQAQGKVEPSRILVPQKGLILTH